MNNIIHKIRQIYPVSEEALQALLMNMQVRHYPKGTYIVQAGVTDRLVYFIEEGVTRSVFHHDGQDTTTWFSQEGDVTFGMDSLYYQQPSVESIETLSDCKIYVIHIDKLNALYETYIDIANWLPECGDSGGSGWKGKNVKWRLCGPGCSGSGCGNQCG